MENTIMSIISILIQTIICTYFITSYCNFVNNIQYTKLQYIINTIFICVSIIVRHSDKKQHSFF